MSDARPPSLSLSAATSIVVASMVGTGVFTSLGFQLPGIPSGFPILVLWGVGGILSLCGALCYAELGAMLPRSGGEYHLLTKAYHPLLGFLAGWVSMTAGFAAPIAAAALVFGSYMHGIWPQLHPQALGVGLVLGIMLVQLCHLQLIERFQLGFTVLKFGLILAFIAGAFFMAGKDWSLLAPKTGDGRLYVSESYAVSLVYVMYAYAGWNAAAYVAGEIRDPHRNVPRALVWGTASVLVLYVMLNAVFLITTPWEAMENQEQVGLISGRAIFGQSGGDAAGALIAFGLIAHVSAMLFSGTRVLRVIGQDAHALRALDRPNRLGAPWLAVVLITAFVLVLMFTGRVEQLLLYIMGLLQVSSFLCVLAVPWLRRRMPKVERPFKVPFYPLPVILYSLVSIWMLVALAIDKPVETAWGATTLIIGVVLYYATRGKASAS
ncbi:APC family permease [Roseimicrobium gellanilyticum]|nr:amino acid permease [Roseimicrobium gellanilyticum]